jgi:hypothetical protein
VVTKRILLALALLAAPGHAHAQDKHAVAVLGVIPKDAALTKSASAINAVIRTQAGAKSSEYTVKGSVKDIDAAVLAAECSTIQPSCAAKLGAALGTDLTIAGELERRGTHLELVLALVDVRTKRRVRSVHQTSASSADMKKLARAAYTRLIGGDLGELAIEANARQGEVLIDGQVVAGLFEGRTRIDGLVKGSHMLAIRAKGYRPLEVDVTIEAETRQMLLLDPE